MTYQVNDRVVVKDELTVPSQWWGRMATIDRIDRRRTAVYHLDFDALPGDGWEWNGGWWTEGAIRPVAPVAGLAARIIDGDHQGRVVQLDACCGSAMDHFNAMPLDNGTWIGVIYSSQVQVIQHPGASDPVADEVVDETCNWCDNAPTQQTMTGYPACEDHGETCHDCGGVVYAGTALAWPVTTYEPNSGYTSVERHLCNDCGVECNDCGVVLLRSDATRVRSRRYCEECTSYCDDCGRYYVTTDGCENDHDGSIQGLDGYGHTYPSMWLGGPVRENGGYYLGFELEIAAESGDANLVNNWAEQALGHNGAVHCKEDSSVEGFEIATQPMTAEFFEAVDWNSFFDVLNGEFPITYDEPVEHGLHVHIGKQAFRRKIKGQWVIDHGMIAAFTYLLNSGGHLERIARRSATGYCAKVEKPVSAAVVYKGNFTGVGGRQYRRVRAEGIYAGRDAVNLGNDATIEVRAFKSTRKPQDLKDAVRLVYVTAEYVRSLRPVHGNIPPKALDWLEFSRWTAINFPEAWPSIAGVQVPRPKVVATKAVTTRVPPVVNYTETIREPRRPRPTVRRPLPGLTAFTEVAEEATMAINRLMENRAVASWPTMTWNVTTPDWEGELLTYDEPDPATVDATVDDQPF